MRRSAIAAGALTFTLALSAVWLRPLAAAPEGEAAVPAATHKVQPVDLVLRFDQEGRVDSANRVKVREIPEEYSGAYEVVEVIKRNGRVKRGEVLVVFDPEPMQEQMRTAGESLDDARKRLETARQEMRVLEEASATTLERAQKSQAAAERTLKIWETNDSPRMLRSAELAVQQSQSRVDDQRQELAQLESMYQGTQLATETKDIVLERARRDLGIAEAWLGLIKGDSRVTIEIAHPQRDRDVRDDVRFATQANEHAKVNTDIGLVRKRLEVVAAERAVRNAEEKLAKLKKDEEGLTLLAPVDGLMTAIDLQPRDSVSARQVVCEILDPGALIVKLSVTAEDLRVLDGPAAISLNLPEYPEAAVKGSIQEVGELGAAAGGGEGAKAGTKFPVVVSIQGAARPLKIGLRCAATSQKTLPGVLAVPRKAVTVEKGQANCTVRSARGDEKRTITLGAGNDEMVQVVSGLAAGDEIVMPEPEGK